MIELALTPEQESFAKSTAAVVERHGAVGALVATAELWWALADLGVLGVCASEIGGTPLDLVAAMQAAGSRTCPGPLVAAAAAGEVLTGDELDAILAGERRATLVGNGLVPWSPEADILLELADDGAWRVEVDDLVPISTLSGEPWGRGRIRRVHRLGDASPAVVLAELAAAAYLLGAGIDLVRRTADHARSRVQFKRPIGDFQAVAHPLARSHAELNATVELVRLLAQGDTTPAGARAARTEAARVSRLASDRAHQAFGAVGFALETGVAATTTRIRQWAVLPITSERTL